MSDRRELPRPVPAVRLGVIGNRDLQGADRAALTKIVTRFLEELRAAIDASVAESRSMTNPEPYVREPTRLFLVDSLAEGADQLVAEAATAGGFGYRLQCPIPFKTEEYKRFFTHDREQSLSAFDRLTRDPANDTVLVELTCSTRDIDRSDGYAAAADILLDNSDLLLAIYDPSLVGSEGGTAETVRKAVATGLPVVSVDIRAPHQVAVSREGDNSGFAFTALTSDLLQEITSVILLPTGISGRAVSPRAARDQMAGLRRFLREPLITGSPLMRSLAMMLHGVYRVFWLAVPWIGSIGAKLRPGAHRRTTDPPTPSDHGDPAHAQVIDEVQRPYRERMAPVDELAGFYMSLYRGSFVMNFVFGALAVLFGLLSYFNHANQSSWLRAEIFVLSIILINFVGSRVWGWHRRALDYRFIAEYLRHMTMLAPLGRCAPLIRPAAQYHGHDPSETWMGWYVRALDRDQGLIEFRTPSVPGVLRMDPAFFDTMRLRLCRDWLTSQYHYYKEIERRFEGAALAFRALMVLLFVTTAAGVGAHLMHFTIGLNESSWRENAVLTIIVAALPAFLGALHGIAVQGELEMTAERAGDMSAYLANAAAKVAQPPADAGSGIMVQLSEQAVAAARMMLEEVLDWRIIHQSHEVELT